MKKINIILALAIATVFVSCREEADYTENPSNLLVNQSTLSFTNQFQTIWNIVNTGYNFWDVTPDTVDWDARYNEYLPKFQELDKNYVSERTTTESAHGDITILNKKYQTTLRNYYSALVAGLKDFHMAVRIRNPYQKGIENMSVQQMADEGIALSASISQEQILSRPYCHLDASGNKMANGDTKTFYKEMYDLLKNSGMALALDSVTITASQSALGSEARFIYALLQLSDGRKVPYFWLSDFSGLVMVLQNYEKNPQDVKANRFIDMYFGGYLKQTTTLSKEEMAGAVLDVRENGGGAVVDIPFYVGQFLGKGDAFWESHHKEGMGRYDMSAYVNDSVNVVDGEMQKLYIDVFPLAKDRISALGVSTFHRDFAAENIPVVCLADIYSVSCAEITTGSIQCMPTGYVIGERTFGGEGQLEASETGYNKNFCGVIGDANLQRYNFYVYTSNFERKMKGKPCYEGYGITPNQEVLYNEKGYKGQLDATIAYLQGKQ